MHTSARRAVAVLLTLLGTLLLAGFVSSASSAQAAPARAAAVDCGYPVSKCVCPSLSVSTTVPDVGETIRVAGAYFEPRATVGLELRPVRDTQTDDVYRVKSVRADQDGAFETTLVMPRDAIGTYDLHAVGGRPDGIPSSCPVDPTQRLQIGGDGTDRGGRNAPGGGPASDANGPEGTAFTGFNLLWLLLLAAALIALGVYAVRRGRTKTEVVRSIHG